MEGLGAVFRPLPVAGHDLRAAHADFAGLAVGHRPAGVVQQALAAQPVDQQAIDGQREHVVQRQRRGHHGAALAACRRGPLPPPGRSFPAPRWRWTARRRACGASSARWTQATATRTWRRPFWFEREKAAGPGGAAAWSQIGDGLSFLRPRRPLRRGRGGRCSAAPLPGSAGPPSPPTAARGRRGPVPAGPGCAGAAAGRRCAPGLP